jgi:hypothetical protein
MMRLDVEGLADTFKTSEGSHGELSVVGERFLVGVLAAGSFPFSNFFRR